MLQTAASVVASPCWTTVWDSALRLIPAPIYPWRLTTLITITLYLQRIDRAGKSIQSRIQRTTSPQCNDLSGFSTTSSVFIEENSDGIYNDVAIMPTQNRAGVAYMDGVNNDRCTVFKPRQVAVAGTLSWWTVAMLDITTPWSTPVLINLTLPTTQPARQTSSWLATTVAIGKAKTLIHTGMWVST